MFSMFRRNIWTCCGCPGVGQVLFSSPDQATLFTGVLSLFEQVSCAEMIPWLCFIFNFHGEVWSKSDLVLWFGIITYWSMNLAPLSMFPLSIQDFSQMLTRWFSKSTRDFLSLCVHAKCSCFFHDLPPVIGIDMKCFNEQAHFFAYIPSLWNMKLWSKHLSKFRIDTHVSMYHIVVRKHTVRASGVFFYRHAAHGEQWRFCLHSPAR